jgi:hypothetical protein
MLGRFGTVDDSAKAKAKAKANRHNSGTRQETGGETGVKHGQRRSVGGVWIEIDSCERVRNDAAPCMTGTR